MPKHVKELGEVSIKRLRHREGPNGISAKANHAVGGVTGLYLQCMPPAEGKTLGSRQWILRVTVGGKRREIGLGGYPDVPTKKAKEHARELKESIKVGIDPITERRSVKERLKAEQLSEVTFRKQAEKYIIKKKEEYKTAKQVTRLSSHMEKYVYPYIGNMLLKDIRRGHLINMLENYYLKVPDTAIRVINHVYHVIQSAIIEEIIPPFNPAQWSGNLSTVFPSKDKVAPVRHHPFLKWRELPNFMEKILADEEISAHVLAFMIYTVSRPGEARLAEWEHIDLDRKIWTIPPGEVKGNDARKSDKKWQIPLTSQAIEILKKQETYKKNKKFVFISKRGRNLDAAYLGSNLNKKYGFDGDAHGFRTTFKVWCQENRVADDEVTELILKHQDTSATRAAYARSQLFEERKRVLTAYCHYAATGETDKTRELSKGRIGKF